MKATVTTCTADHLPPESGKIGIKPGMTVRDVLEAVREFGRDGFGNIGGCRADLSDGTAIVVDCWTGTGGCQLMSSQEIKRVSYADGRETTVRKYGWTA